MDFCLEIKLTMMTYIQVYPVCLITTDYRRPMSMFTADQRE